MRTRSAEVNGTPIRWAEAGEADGRPVVLLHGIPTSPALWRHVVPELHGARALAFEMVGYGGSIPAGRRRDISVAAQAGYLLDWLDELEVERPIVAAHDLGGGVAQIAATSAPQRFGGLLLTNAIGYDSWPIPPMKAMRAAGALVRRMPGPLMKSGLGLLIARGHDDAAMARESLDVHWAPYAEHDGAAALVRQAESLDVNDTLAVVDMLPQLDLPARIVWGAADPFQRLKYGERFARDLDAPIERIEGGKHFTPEDHPDRIAAAIHELLAA